MFWQAMPNPYTMAPCLLLLAMGCPTTWPWELLLCQSSTGSGVSSASPAAIIKVVLSADHIKRNLLAAPDGSCVCHIQQAECVTLTCKLILKLSYTETVISNDLICYPLSRKPFLQQLLLILNI